MQGIVFRVAVLLAVVLVLWFGILLARRRIDRERRMALVSPATLPSELGLPPGGNALVRILAFASEGCRPCHTLQRPALDQVAATYGATVEISWIDAPSSPELTELYHVLTVPTTVVLDTHKQLVHAVNYGFASTPRLLEQINAVVGSAVSVGEHAKDLA
jgi:hypothetical protein